MSHYVSITTTPPSLQSRCSLCVSCHAVCGLCRWLPLFKWWPSSPCILSSQAIPPENFLSSTTYPKRQMRSTAWIGTRIGFQDDYDESLRDVAAVLSTVHPHSILMDVNCGIDLDAFKNLQITFLRSSGLRAHNANLNIVLACRPDMYISINSRDVELRDFDHSLSEQLALHDPKTGNIYKNESVYTSNYGSVLSMHRQHQNILLVVARGYENIDIRSQLFGSSIVILPRAVPRVSFPSSRLHTPI